MSKTSQSKPLPRPRDWRSVLPGMSLVALVVLVYFPALSGGFIWDDDSNIIDSRALRSLAGLWRIWLQPGATQQYYPLTHSSFWLDYHLWGLHPFGYHLENILLHALSSVMLWMLLCRLNVAGAWLGAALFALHPVNVETVAWITERKNTLSGVFFMASLLAAVKFWRLSEPKTLDAGNNPKHWRSYCLALVLYVCALWSKTATVGLPVVILLLIWWKRGWPKLRDFVYLVPFIAVGIATGLATMWVEMHHLGVTSGVWDGLSRCDRMLIAGRALWFYLGKLVWPHPLMFMYPRWTVRVSDPVAWLPLLAAVAGLCLLWNKRNSWSRASLVAAAYFVVMLFPILGFFNSSFFMYSFVNDHFQYLAEIGPLALAAAGITIALHRLTQPQALRQPAVYATLLLAAGALSWRQTAVYHNLETLWRDTLAHNPDSWMAHENLGACLSEAGHFEDAASEYREALTLHPNDHRAYNNLGLDADRQGNHEDAIRYFTQAVDIFPKYALGHYNLGRALAARGQFDDAQQHLRLAVQLDPQFTQGQFTLGNVLEHQGELDEAVTQYRQVLELEPDFPLAHADLGRVLARQGKLDEAMDQYQLALKADPQCVDALANLGNALVSKQRFSEAADCYQRAIQVDSNSPILHYDLGVALDRLGNRDQAQAELAKARQLQAARLNTQSPAAQ